MSTFVSDTFTDTNGVVLTAHNSDIGMTWAGSVMTIQSNQVTFGTFGTAVCFSTRVPTSPDYSVQATIVFNGATRAASFGGVTARGSISSDYYRAMYDGDAEVWRLQKLASTVVTNLGSTFAMAYVQGASHTVKLTLTGTSLEVFIDGVSRITATDSTHAGIGRAGIYLEDGAGTVSLRADNFLATDASTKIQDVVRGITPGTDDFQTTFGPATSGTLALTPVAGNFLYCVLFLDGLEVGQSVTAPTGWNKLTPDFVCGDRSSSRGATIHIFWKIAGASEPKFVTIPSWLNSSAVQMLYLAEWPADAIRPIDTAMSGTQTAVAGWSTPLTILPISINNVGAIEVIGVANPGADPAAESFTTGFQQETNYKNLAVYTKVASAAGNTGNRSLANATFKGNAAIFSFAIAPLNSYAALSGIRPQLRRRGRHPAVASPGSYF